MPYIGHDNREYEDIELDSMRKRDKGRKPAKITRHDPRNPFYDPTLKEAWYFLYASSRASGYQIVLDSDSPFITFYEHGGILFPRSLDGITRAVTWLSKREDEKVRAALAREQDAIGIDRDAF